MYDYLKLIIFNIIIIFLSFTFKKHIIIFYPFLLLFMLSYETILKNKLVEGNFQDDLYKTISNFKEKEKKIDLPLGKIEKILEKMLEKFSGTKMTDDNKCQGEFYINKLTNKECGEGFNERLYKIIDEGDGNCLHSELYKEKIPLPSCKFNEICYSDLDCESNNCSESRCIEKLDCNENMLSGCNRRSCLALNSGLDRDIYYYQNNECNVDPCNEQNYRMCDEGGCNSLSYRYKFNDTRGICEQIVQEVDDTGLRTDSYMSLISGFGDKGCSQNNPQDCSGVCSEFNENTTEYCTIGGTIDNPKPHYQCLSPSDNSNYLNIDERNIRTIYDNNNEFPCTLFHNDLHGLTSNIRFTGINIPATDQVELELKTYICDEILDGMYENTNHCLSNIEFKDGSFIIEFKTSINQDEINLQEISEEIKNYLEGLNLPDIVSIEIDPIQTNSYIQEITCNDNQIIQNGMCKTCEAGTHKVDNICKDCQAGTYNGERGGSCQSCDSYDTGTTWEPGYYQNSTGQTRCLPVPENSQSNEDHTGWSCNSGYYQSETGQTECIQVPENSQSNEDHTGWSCIGGYELNTDGDMCVACVAGKYSVGGMDGCQSCDSYEPSTGSRWPYGYYQSETGQTECLQVPENSSHTDNFSDFECNDGYIVREEQCEPCEAGHFESDGECKSCESYVSTTTRQDPLLGTIVMQTTGSFYQPLPAQTNCLRVPLNSHNTDDFTFFECNDGYTRRVMFDPPPPHYVCQPVTPSLPRPIRARSPQPTSGIQAIITAADPGSLAAAAQTTAAADGTR